ncbi:hypothetical protein ACTMU2_17675 [Cupriavidus basilensis]
MSDTRFMQDEVARRALKDDLTRFNCRVAQPDDPPLFTRTPHSSAQTVLWRWSDLAPSWTGLDKSWISGLAGSVALCACTIPGLPYGTTPTFWGSICKLSCQEKSRPPTVIPQAHSASS